MTGGWVWLISPVNGLPHRVPDHEEVIASFVGRDFVRTDIPGDIDSDTEEFALELAKLQASDQAAELRGKALDEALEAAGLSKSGSVEEKRQRLADHEAAEVPPQADTATDQEGNE